MEANRASESGVSRTVRRILGESLNFPTRLFFLSLTLVTEQTAHETLFEFLIRPAITDFLFTGAFFLKEGIH